MTIEEINKLETIEVIERKEFLNDVSKNISETFPFSEEEKLEFNKQIADVESNLSGFNSSEEFVWKIKEGIASINNTHTNLQEKMPDKFFIMDPKIEYKAGGFWIDKNNKMSKVKEIDEQPIQDLVEKQKNIIGGGTEDWKNASAINQLMYFQESKKTELLVNDKDELKKISIDCVDNQTYRKESKPEDFVSSQRLENNIGYLKVNSWSNKINADGMGIDEMVNKEMDNIDNSSAFIIDVRKNSGGDSEIASQLAERFIKEETKYAKADKRRGNDYNKVDFNIRPKEPVIDKQVVVLTGPENLSSCELFILMMKDTGRAKTIGERTGGGSGCPKSFNVNLGDKEFKLNVATWKVTRNNGESLENIGIEPDIEVKPSQEDIEQGKDVVLNEAIKYVESSVVG